MSTGAFQPGAVSYTQTFGATPAGVSVPHLDVRNPTSSDILYPIGMRWVNEVGNTEYVLTSLTSFNGVTTANWVVSAGGSGGGTNTLTGDSGVATEVGGNINVVGAGGITTSGSGDTLTISGSGVGATTLTGNAGTATESAGNFNVVGSGSLTTSGAGATLTASLTGLTNHAVLVGAGTATITKVGPSATSGQILQSQGAAADPAYSTATYPSTTTANNILYSSATNTVAEIATANSASLVTDSSGVPAYTSSMTNGQVVIGATGGTPTPGNITGSSGILVTNGAGTINISSNSTFLYVSVNSGVSPMLVNRGYITLISSAQNYLLPVGASTGQQVQIIGSGSNSGALWTVTQAAGQQIFINGTNTTVGAGGSIAATEPYNTITLICTGANTWTVLNSMGVLTVT